MAVPVVGFDIGAQSSYVAVAKGGGIEVIDNEYNYRATPTCVGFVEGSRIVGTDAENSRAKNYKNTLVNFLPLVGKLANDRSCVKALDNIFQTTATNEDGRILLQTQFDGETFLLTPEQILAMQLKKLKNLAESNLGTSVTDVVINVPTYYTDCERRAILDAAHIAGLKCIKLLNDLTSIATVYGIYKTDLPAVGEPEKIVVFISVGHTSTQVSICAYNKSKMKVLSTAWDTELGGRSFDQILFAKFSEEFFTKYKSKIQDSPKAVIRLMKECERLKKLLSANAQSMPINAENLKDDIDFSSKLNRAEFETLCEDLIQRFESVLLNCLEKSKLKVSQIHVVEMVGGGCRIPALKEKAKSVFKQDIRTTLNADEVVVFGCALHAAMLSPGARVREFGVNELCSYSITLQWDNKDNIDNVVGPDENDDSVVLSNKETSLEAFPANYSIPSSRRIILKRRGPFKLKAVYTDPDALPNDNVVIGEFMVKGSFNDKDEPSRVRLKVRMNEHGIFLLSDAEIAEDYEKDVEVEVPVELVADINEDDKPMDVEAPADSAENGPTVETKPTAKTSKPKVKKEIVKKKFTRYHALQVDALVSHFSPKRLNEFMELDMMFAHRTEQELRRTSARNALESYECQMRSELEQDLANFATQEERTTLLQKCEDINIWLYEDGEKETRQVYADKLSDLESIGEKIKFRASEYDRRKPVVGNMERYINHIRTVLDSIEKGEETFDHLTEEQRGRLMSEVTTSDAWLKERIQTQSSRKLSEDPVVTCAEISTKHMDFAKICDPILATPKPVVTPPAPPMNETTSTKGDSGTNHVNENDAKMNTNGFNKNEDTIPNNPQSMEVD